ncbi:MAG: SPASM domain-containing protein [Candidatus Eisenbacteria bacterium]|nr:SPASM domain-containing protein [Candidatus Eisenbacteria bacterium]
MPGVDPASVTIMIKPVGARCTGTCAYCYYGPGEQSGGTGETMEFNVLESVFAGYLPRAPGCVTIAWQGGEPTLAGLPFFRRAVQAAARHARPGQTVTHTLQTNGTLLNEAWCRFLRDNRFLVGLSIDGPRHLHDSYRTLRSGGSSHEAAASAFRSLRDHGVACNVLSVIHDGNVHAPDEVLGHLLDLGARWLQFIPVIEWTPDEGSGSKRPASWCPDPLAYGRFLCRILDLWLARHRDSVSERAIDALIYRMTTGVESLCTAASLCARQLTVESDGSVYACDHFVTPEWRLGRICGNGPSLDREWPAGVDGAALARFVLRKRDLAEGCRGCEWRTFCGGGCPKHRPAEGLPSVLCPGYRLWFAHAVPRLEPLAREMRARDRSTSSRFGQDRITETAPRSGFQGPEGRNSPCPCGSGLKWKRCCGAHDRS